MTHFLPPNDIGPKNVSFLAATCEFCGRVGVRHAFYSKSKRFCTLACSRSYSASMKDKVGTMLLVCSLLKVHQQTYSHTAPLTQGFSSFQRFIFEQMTKNVHHKLKKTKRGKIPGANSAGEC